MTKGLLYVLGIIVAVNFTTPSASGEQINLGTLLSEMLDRTKIAEFPAPAFVCKQASSYNRVSVKPGQPTWYATGDCSHFIRCEKVGDRREWVMLDADGPGAIVRWWATQYKYDGTIRIYLDGSDKPVIEGKANQVIGGAEGGTATAPLAAMRARGCNLYLPIPFSKHCKITYDGLNMHETKKFADNIYYNINYIQYQKDTNVKTFTKDDLKTHAKMLARVQSELLKPETNGLPAKRKIKGDKVVLKPGENITREVSGIGAICRIRVKVTADDIKQAMRSTVIKGVFDDKQRIWAPVGGFFGSGPGLNPFKSWWRQVEKDGMMTCRWPMPFKKTASISIVNYGKATVTVQLDNISVADWKWTPQTMYFNSSWRGDDHIAVFGNDYTKGEEWNYIKIRGRGVYVGDTMAVFNRPKRCRQGPWWGEGDEKIYVDGELFPSHFGTGTEDYFGYAWGTQAPFEAPFHAQPIGRANRGVGHTVNTRTRSLDRIPFKKTLKFDMELMHWQSNTNIDYAATTYWYAEDKATGNGQTAPQRVRRKIGDPGQEVPYRK